MSEVTDSLGHTETYRYDSHGNILTQTDKNGNPTHWAYESESEDAQCVARWGKYKTSTEHFEYLDNKTIVTSPTGGKTTHYFEFGNIIQTTDPLGNSEYWDYDLYGQVTLHTDQLGQNTYYGYDQYGHQTSIRLPNGASTAWIYENHKVKAAKNPHNALWSWKYNEQGKPIIKIGPKQDITRYQYQEGLLTKIIDSKGEEVHLTYNEHSLLESVSLPNGLTTHWEYDEYGQVTRESNNEEQYQDYTYDALGRLTNIRTTDQNLIDLEYDALGNVIKAVDKRHEVNFMYSATGKLLSREENNKTIDFKYDRNDELISITNEEKEQYTFKRDLAGNIIQEQGFDKLTRNYTRDAKGQVSRVEVPEADTIDYLYDKLGNVSRIRYEEGKVEEIYTYNPLGLLIQASNPHSTVRLERDDLGNIIEEKQNGVSVYSKYNRESERLSLSSSLGAEINMERNLFGDITSTQATQKTDTHTAHWEAHMNRNMLGLEIERSLPGGIKSKWVRDATGKPKTHSLSMQEAGKKDRHLHETRYNWDVNDRLQNIYREQTSALIEYKHDAFGNLASAYHRKEDHWDYKVPDAVGNIYKDEKREGRTYGKAGQLIKDEQWYYLYDKKGNLVKKTTNKDSARKEAFDKAYEEYLEEKKTDSKFWGWFGQNAEEPKLDLTPEGDLTRWDKGDWYYHWLSNGLLGFVITPDSEKVAFEYDALGRRTATVSYTHLTLPTTSRV